MILNVVKEMQYIPVRNRVTEPPFTILYRMIEPVESTIESRTHFWRVMHKDILKA